ncbi:MAG: hypothetical protein WD004_00945 [Actinomycetota bacterium]
MSGAAKTSHSVRSALIIAGVSVASAIALAFMYPRVSFGIDVGLPTFLGACERIKESGIPPHPGDWWCSVPAWHIDANLIIGSVLIGVGLALAVAVLAATGRRASAILPLIPMLFFADSVDRNTSISPLWLTSDTVRWIVWLVLPVLVLAAPGIAVALTSRRGPLMIARSGVRPRLLSAIACVLASAAVVVLTLIVLGTHLRGIVDSFWSLASEIGAWWIVPAISIAFFGALLGSRKPWWPWSIAFVAFFLSRGPSQLTFFEWHPEGGDNLTAFGLTIPLLAIGLIWSKWETWASRLAKGSNRVARQSQATAGATPQALPRGGRAYLALNLLAVALMIFAASLFVADPLPRRLNTPLPTYLEERNQANDVRTRMNLASAMESVDAYRARHATYSGFDARVGERMDPSLAWVDGFGDRALLEATDEGGSNATINIIQATPTRARLVAASDSGAGFCIQHRAGAPWDYGASDAKIQGRNAVLRSASSNCGSEGWTPDLVEWPELPDCVARTTGFLICRMVSVLMYNALKAPGATSGP